MTNVAHALGIANEAFEELSDAAAVTSIEDTLVLQKDWNNDLDQLRGFNLIYFMIFINGIIKNTWGEVNNSDKFVLNKYYEK